LTALQTQQQPSRGVSVAKSEIGRRRAAMDADVWLFIKWVCGHGADDIARFHRPLAYFLAGDAVRLAACLNKYDSEICTQVKADLVRRGIDWNTRQGISRLARLLRRVNNRVSRSMGKTTIGLDVMLWKATVNPDISILIASKSDDAAWAMCESIGNIMLTDSYKLYYGDRVNPEWITKKWIRMVGRTVSHQDTIEARGVTSQSYSKHYHEIYCDDLASTEAKQGDATVADAVRFMASLHGISISERWGGTRYVFNGTIQGPHDDHSKLANNPEYLSVVVPIWRHPKGVKWTVKNMNEDGIPVLPELYDTESCRAKRADTLASDSLGKISWLQNFLMCAHEAGSMQFTAELLRSQSFMWIIRTDTTSGKQWREIRRYLFELDDKGNRVPKRNPLLKHAANCPCPMSCGLPDHEFVQFDPLTMPRTLGVDQAISGIGDQWGVGGSCVDSYGHKYQLKGAYDRGYWKMVPAIALVFKRWGGMLNPPEKIGIESNVWQGMSADWLKRSEELQYLARRIEKLPPSNIAKVARIYNDIYSGLEDGTLWIDPEDEIFTRCALEYNAADPDNQWDDPLDCVAMSIQVHKRAASGIDEKAMRDIVAMQEQSFTRDCDAGNWLDTSASFLEFASWN
jgi:hypothetical protein